ncbi:MAG TPA: lamin tail domain-containing protein [Pyrinomonadaceae bacterium]|nr:lamin tail domain-containing protein [Pyrinomonadaceae bacterium]
MKSFTPTSSPRNSRAFLASLLTCILLVTPLTPLGLAQKIQSRAKSGDGQQSPRKSTGVSQPGNGAQKITPVAPNLTSSEIVATKTDTILNDTLGDGKAQAGDTIRYDITVTNNGATDAIDVAINDMIDGNTTLVSNSIHAQPQARNDSYTTVGNTLLKVGVAAGTDPEVRVTGSAFDNDANATDTNTFVSNTQPANGSVTFNSDGTFTYLPNVNFRGPTDTFTYTIRNNADNSLTDTATVTINITGMVWYVNNAGANGDGRSSSPFNTLTPVNNAASDVDQAGDYIYLSTGNGSPYTTGLALESNQQFIGNGVALVVPINATPTTLRAAGTRPTLSNGTGNALTLAGNNTAQGLDLTAAANTALFGSGISGTNNVSDMNITTTASGTAVSLANQAGTFNYSGGSGSSITGNSSGKAVVISGGNGNITFFGVPVSQSGGGVVDIQGRTGGTVSFENGSTVTQTAGTVDAVVLLNNTGGSVINFLNNVNLTTNSGRGLYTDNTTATTFTLNMNAAGNNINATGGAAIDVADIAADLDFQTLSSTNSVAAGSSSGVRISNLPNTPAGRSITVTGTTTVNNSAATGVSVQSTGAAVTFATLNSAPLAGQIGFLADTNTGTVTSTGGTITATDAIAVSVLNSPLNMTLTSVSTNNTGDGDPGVSLNGLTGTLVMQGGSLVGGNAQAFFANAQNGNITYNGTISQANAFRLIEVTNKTGGTVNFGGAVSATAGTGILLNANGNTTFNFTNGISLSTGANDAFTATGGGTVNATQNNSSIINTLSTTGGTALKVTNTNIGANGLTFRSITSGSGANSTANGIILDTTGTAGGLTVTGTGSTASGGTIQRKTGADGSFATVGTGIYLNSTSSVSLTRMQLNDFENFAIRGNNVSGFSFTDSVINGSNGNNSAGGGSDESAIRFDGLTGSATISNNTISQGHEFLVKILNTSGTLNRLTMNNNSFGTNSATLGGDAVQIVAGNTAVLNATVNSNVFTNAREDLFNAAATQTSSMDLVFRLNTLSNSNVPLLSTRTNVLLFSTSTGTVTYDISCNKSTGGNDGPAIAAAKGVPDSGSGGTMTGSIVNNRIGTAGVAASGSESASGIFVSSLRSGTHTTRIASNIIKRYDEAGIFMRANDGASTLNATIESNVVNEPDSQAFAGLHADNGAVATDTNVTNILIGNFSNAGLKNDFTAGDPANGTDVDLQVLRGTMNLSRAGSGAGTAAGVVQDDNIGGAALTVSAFAIPGASTLNLVNTTPAQPPAVAGCTPPALTGAGPRDETSAADSDSVETSASAPAAPQQPAASNNVIGQPFVSFPQAAATNAGAAQPQARTTSEKAGSKQGDAQASKTADGGGNAQPLASAFPVTIPVLKAGESVTITFQVTVKSDIANNVTSVSNQGQITSPSLTPAGTMVPTQNKEGNTVTGGPTVTQILPKPTYTINNARVPEPATGSVYMPFTVTLSHAYGSTASVSFSTADGTATAASGDYSATTGTLSFAAGQTVQTISVPVLANGNTTDEDFTVTLNTPVNSVLGATATATGLITEANPPGRVLISEVRTSGPNGEGDDFVELYNNQNVSQDISGWAVFKLDSSCEATPVVVAVIPANTTLPPRGHYLIVGPAYNGANFGNTTGNPTVAAVADIESDRNLALFSTSNVLSLSTETREDAVGFTVNAGGLNNCDLLVEGSSLPSALGNVVSQYSFARRLTTGLPKDTNDSAADFQLVTTTPAVAVGENLTPALGAPGPENLTAPIQRNDVVKASLIDGTVAATAPPNRVRSSFGANSTNAAFGTLSIQRRFKNTLAVPVSRLRFRVVDLTTINNRPAGAADLRVLSSNGQVRNSAGTLVVTVTGLTLEGPPQPNGGGLNSTLTVIPPGGSLAAGSTIDVQFLLGVQEQGNFSFFVNVEALPAPAGFSEGATTKSGTAGKQRTAAAAGSEASEPKEKQ